MIAVGLVCVGKLKESYLREASAEYEKRLSRFCKFSVKEVAEQRSDAKSAAEIETVKRAEGERLIAALGGGYVVVLDGRGRQATSEEIAATLAAAAQRTSHIDFVIGGSYGLSDEVRARADEVISFGKITFPYQLIRIVAEEQIYRAFTINNNVAYHK